MLDAWAIVQAQTALQLNDGQYGQFVTRLKRLQETGGATGRCGTGCSRRFARWWLRA